MASPLLRQASLRGGPFQRSGSSSSSGVPAPASSSSAPLAPPFALKSQPASQASRRDVMLLSSSLVVSHIAQLIGAQMPSHAGGLDRYVRRKQLDPLESYVPLVLEARSLVARVADLGEADPGLARNLLRQGPYNGLRDNIRALGEYAVRNGRTTEAGALVTGFFRSLEALDLLLYTAFRDKSPVDPQELASKSQDLQAAFDKLIATVPDDILARSERVLAVAQAKAGAVEAGAPGPAVGPAVEQSDEELIMLLRR